MSTSHPKFVSSHIANLLTQADGNDLRQRLELYQVFTKLYEHHRGLLNEILDLENSTSRIVQQTGLFHYVQGVVNGAQAHIVTNFIDRQSQAIHHPAQVWIIGRDRQRSSIHIRDQRLSRVHAAIRYIPEHGFYLIDLNSTNGCFVNGSRVRQGCPLQDGDRVRLGSFAFAFFLCHQQLQAAAPQPNTLAELQALLNIDPTRLPLSTSTPYPSEPTLDSPRLDDTETYCLLRPELSAPEPSEPTAAPPADTPS